MKLKTNTIHIIFFVAIIILLTIFIIVRIITPDSISDEHTVGTVDIDVSNNNSITPEEQFDVLMSQIASEYESEVSDLQKNTTIDKNGNIRYYNDYMISDFDELDINYVRNYSLSNNGFLLSDMTGSDLYCLLYYGLKNTYSTDEAPFICNFNNIETVKTGYIYRCYIEGNNLSLIMLIDVGNCKIHIE